MDFRDLIHVAPPHVPNLSVVIENDVFPAGWWKFDKRRPSSSMWQTLPP